MALFGYNNVNWDEKWGKTNWQGLRPSTTDNAYRPWPWVDYDALKRFAEYKELRDLVKKQEKEIEHLRETISSLLDIIKNMSKDNRQP